MGNPRETTNKLVMLFVSLAQVVLGLRVIFSLFNFDATNSLVRWVYSMSETLLMPFDGMFSEQAFDHTYVLEFRVLFALVAYSVVGFLAISLVNWAGGSKAAGRPKTSSLRKWLRDRLA